MFNHLPNHPKRVLLAVDGSENSLYAAATLRDLPLGADVEITALAVQPGPDFPGEGVYDVLLTRAEHFFEETGDKIYTRLLHGNPAEELIGFAKAYQPDLIVMGAKGLRATLGILLGGVAQQVVEYACCPVLIVRGPYLSLNRILIAVDGSITSQATVNYFTHFALPEHATIYVMHVLAPAPSPEVIARTWAVPVEAIEPISLQEIKQDLQRQAEEEEHCSQQELIAPIVEQLRKAGHKVECALVRGDAATEIIEFAKEHDIDWIVAGSRGLSRVQGWLLGSVSRKLVHYASCSVLIVKTPDESK